MKKLTLVLFALLVAMLATVSSAQVLQEGDLTDHLDTIIAAMPTTVDGGDYLQPNLASRELWREIIDHILAGEYAEAHTKALAKNYQVTLFTDTESEDSAVHAILERTPASTSRYWGTFVFGLTPWRPHLVIEAPHPRYDSNTGYQSVRIYQFNRPRALFIAGTHRCNGQSYSPCDGSTTACSGTSEDYRYSDQAHVVDSTFQITTQAMMDDDTQLLVIQPHGFAQGTEDPDLIISNGTRNTPSGYDFAVAVSNAIKTVDTSLTTKVGHIDLAWTRLLGTTNTQGRLVNGTSDPCGTYATSATGGFVHIEQARPGLRDTPLNWMKLAEAIALAVPNDLSSAPLENILGGGVRITGNYANPFYGRTRIEFELDRTGTATMEVFDLAGRRVARLANESYAAGAYSLDWNARRLPSGTYFIRLRQGGQIATKRCVLLR